MAGQDMLIANRGLTEDLIGFGVVGRATRLVLVRGLADAIKRHQDRWSAADLAYEAAGHDVGLAAKGVETVKTANIFHGPHKSLLESPMERFPNVSVTAYALRAAPGAAELDTSRRVELSLLVEIMVKAGPVPRGQDLFYDSLVHRRVERTSEAVLRVIQDSENLLGSVEAITEPLGGILNSSWRRGAEDGGGDSGYYLLHGARFTYALNRQVSR